MNRFMRWLGFISIYEVPELPAPIPGRAGQSIWDEMIEEFGDPALIFDGPALFPDWAAA